MFALSRRSLSRDLSLLHGETARVLEKHSVRSRAFWDHAVDGGDAIPLDMYEDGNNFVVIASVSGVKPERVRAKVQDNILTITYETRNDQEHKDQDYYLREIRYGRFSRSVELPHAIDAGKADAVFADGVLTLRLPKTDEPRGKRIRITKK